MASSAAFASLSNPVHSGKIRTAFSNLGVFVNGLLHCFKQNESALAQQSPDEIFPPLVPSLLFSQLTLTRQYTKSHTKAIHEAKNGFLRSVAYN